MYDWRDNRVLRPRVRCATNKRDRQRREILLRFNDGQAAARVGMCGKLVHVLCSHL
jgi:hypothetical protein